MTINVLIENQPSVGKNVIKPVVVSWRERNGEAWVLSHKLEQGESFSVCGLPEYIAITEGGDVHIKNNTKNNPELEYLHLSFTQGTAQYPGVPPIPVKPDEQVEIFLYEQELFNLDRSCRGIIIVPRYKK